MRRGRCRLPSCPISAWARAGANLLGRAAAIVADGAAVGLALSNYLAESNLLHLKYLAIDPTRRSQGLGAILLRAAAAAGETIAQAAGREGCAGTLLEVEIPDSPPPAADRSLRQRRIAFYERHGALRTGVPFPRPPWAPAEQPDWEVLLLPGLRVAQHPGWRNAARPGPRAPGGGLSGRSPGPLARRVPGCACSAGVRDRACRIARAAPAVFAALRGYAIISQPEIRDCAVPGGPTTPDIACTPGSQEADQ